MRFPRRAAQRPDDGFDGFVAARSAALTRTAVLLVGGDVHLAQDLVQEALVRVVGRWTTICAAGDPEPYVRRVLYTLAIDGWRARRRRPEVAAGAVPETAGPDASEGHATRLVLRESLARLTPRQRAVLVLRFYDDRTETQTAEAMGCSVSTVKSQTRHALMRLRELAPDLAETFDRAAAPKEPVR